MIQTSIGHNDLLIAGGGIGGLAAALACARSGWGVRLYEKADVFSEFGAGIQLGPNVVRILHAWGLREALAQVASLPSHLQVRCARRGRELGHLPLAGRAQALYGAPYLTIHRADMHQMLLHEVQKLGHVQLHLNNPVRSVKQTEDAVTVRMSNGTKIQADALIGADGLWGVVRDHILPAKRPRVSGHLAYRAVIEQKTLPASLRSQHITAWLSDRLHAVVYPVRAGDYLNVVVIVEEPFKGDLCHWDHSANAAHLQQRVQGSCAPLQDLIHAIPFWRLWSLCDRPPVASADEMAQGRVALLGDAAHPTRPYLAQGAGMAIEDADEISRALSMRDLDMALRLRRYALNRWQRCARIQARSALNGRIFHASGLVRLGRDWGMKLGGTRVLDLPWLYQPSS